MNIFLVTFLTLVAAVAAGLGRALWRQRKPAPAAGLPDWQHLTARGSVLDTYAPLTRLFRQEDFSFLAAQIGSQRKLLRRFERQRWNILHLYLKQLRADYEGVYRICRLLAVASDEPAFSFLISRYAFRIYSLLLLLDVRCFFRWSYSVHADTVALVEAFNRFDAAVRALLPLLAPRPGMALDRA